MNEAINQLSRQSLRRMGIAEIREQLRKQYPLASRASINKVARALHKTAWDERDKEAVEKIKGESHGQETAGRRKAAGTEAAQ